MPGGYDGSVRIDTRIDSKGFNSGLQTMIGSLKRLGTAIGLAFSVGAVVQFGKTAVNTASGLANALTGLNSVLTGTGKSFSEARVFIDDYIKDGLIPATNAINAYKNLALRGYDTSQIQTTLQALKDAAAFGRQASLTMGEAVQSASEGLKNENSILVDNAGVTKNVAAMWKDYADSIGTTVNNLSRQQKIQAEVNGILAESKYQAGDAAKLAGNYSGQVSALGTSFYNLRVAIGNTIIPIWSKVIVAIKPVVDWLVILFNKLAQVMSLLFNVKIGGDTGMGAVAADTQAAADAQGEFAANTADAGKAAKGALAAFDELNVLQRDTDASGSTGTSGTGGTGVTIGESVLPEESALTETVDRLKAKFAELTEPLQAPFQRLKDALGELGGTIWSYLQPVWETVLKPIGEWATKEVAPRFLDLLAEAVNVLNEALIAVKPLAEDFYNFVLVPIGEWTGQAVLDALDFLTERLKKLGDWIRENPEDFRTMTAVIVGFFAAWKVSQLLVWLDVLILKLGEFVLALGLNTGAWIANTAAKIADKVQTIAIAALYAGDFIKNLALSAARLATETAAWIASTAAKIAANVAQIALNVAVGIWNGIAVVATAVTTAFGAAVAFLTSPIGLVIIAIVAIIAIIVLLVKNWDWVKETAGKVWDWIVQKWGEAGEWFRTKITEPIKEAFKTALDWIEDKWKTVFNGIKDFVKEKINLIIDFINGMIQAVASGINGVIGALNKIKIELPAKPPWFSGLSLGVNIPLVSVPQIPRLATGAVIPPNAEFLAVMGDQRHGNNLEGPESMFRGIVSEVVNGALENLEIKTRIEFAGTLGQLVRELKPYIDKENVRVGRSLIRKTI